MGASAFDVLFAVLYEVFSTTAVFLFDAVWIILRTLFDILKMLVKSGLLQTLIGIGVDFLIIVALEIGVPLLIAGIDFVVCVFQLFLIDTWASQLECIEGARPLAAGLLFLCVPTNCPLSARRQVLPRPRRRRRPVDL